MKKELIGFIRRKVSTDPLWARRALLQIYSRQTEDEKMIGETSHQNGIGFNGCDAPILTSFAEQLKSRGFLSRKQEEILQKKIGRYSRQLLEVADPDKLERFYKKELN